MSFLGFSRVDFPFAGSATQFLSANYPGTAFIDNSTLIPPALASYDEVRNIQGALWFVINATWNPQTLSWLQVDPSKPSEATVFNATGGFSFFTAAALGGVLTNQTITFLPAGQIIPPANGIYYSDRNKLINGGMGIDQRNNGASVTASGTGGASLYGVDRWKLANFGTSAASKWSAQQVAFNALPTAGSRFASTLTSLSSYAVVSTDQMVFEQSVEGNNVQDLGWGTTSAKSCALSFVAVASVSGTYSVAITNYTNTRSYVTTVALSAGVATAISLVIPGDTGGTWVQSGTSGALVVAFNVGTGTTGSTASAGVWQTGFFTNITGSTQLVATNAATLTITDVQFETGLTATPFEVRSFGTELALCQRYFITINSLLGANSGFGTCSAFNANTAYIITDFPVLMRAVPTLTTSAAATFVISINGGSVTPNSAPVLGGGQASISTATVAFGTAAALTTGQAGLIQSVNTTAFLNFSAEL